jgi:hypothetical protein
MERQPKQATLVLLKYNFTLNVKERLLDSLTILKNIDLPRLINNEHSS